jgi:acetylornithine deacetylase/succinyl-diaminopimelate desuccinylase-like protein
MPIQLMHQIREEVYELLQKRVCIDTTNPPSNETLAAQFLEKELSKLPASYQTVSKVIV